MTAYLAPGMQEFVDELRAANAPHPQTLPLAVVRQNMEDQAVRWNAFPVEGVTHSDSTIAGLAVRVYRPADALPDHAMVYLHGGGWTAGSITTHDNMVRRLAAASGMVVVSVNYRLAPEHPAPAGVDDTLAVLDALARGAAGLRFDMANLCLGGDSAGANVALGALVALKARGGPLPFAALLLYGCFAPVFDTWSNQQYGNGDWGLSTSRMQWYWGNHLGSLPPDDPIAAPLHADLRGLPFLYITVAGLDPLAEDSFLLARRCIDQGVSTIVDPVPGVIHGFGKYAPVVPAASDALRRAGHALRAARHGPGAGPH
jgi:acetyl esterase